MNQSISAGKSLSSIGSSFISPPDGTESRFALHCAPISAGSSSLPDGRRTRGRPPKESSGWRRSRLRTTLLAFAMFQIRHSKESWIVEHSAGKFERHTVFANIGIRFDLVPFELKHPTIHDLLSHTILSETTTTLGGIGHQPRRFRLFRCRPEPQIKPSGHFRLDLPPEFAHPANRPRNSGLRGSALILLISEPANEGDSSRNTELSSPRGEKLQPVLHLFDWATADQPHDPPQFFAHRVLLLRRHNNARMRTLQAHPALMQGAVIGRVVGE